MLKVLGKPHFAGFYGAFEVETTLILCGYRYGPYIAIHSMHYVPNRSSTPEETFRIHRADLRYVPSNIIGIAHRHPPGLLEPSPMDINGIPKGLVGVVWCEGETRWYTNTGVKDVVYLE